MLIVLRSTISTNNILNYSCGPIILMLSHIKNKNRRRILTEFHRVKPAVDVQDQVHFEGLGFAMEPAHCNHPSSIAAQPRKPEKRNGKVVIVR